MRVAWHGRWRTTWRRRPTSSEGGTHGSPRVPGDVHARRGRRRPRPGNPPHGIHRAADDRGSGRSRIARRRWHRQGAGGLPVDGPARRAGLRPSGGDRPPRQADRAHLPPQSQRAQLLARPRRGLPAVLRRGRTNVGERTPGPARQRPRREPRQLERGRRDRMLLSPMSRSRAPGRDQHRARAGRLSGTGALGAGGGGRAATRRRRVRDVLAPAGQGSGAARVGATGERGAQRHLPGPVSAREECRPSEGCRLAYLAQQFVCTALPCGARLRRVRQLFGLPEGGDVQQLRRPAPCAIHSKHPCDAARGPDTRTGPGLHLRRPAISRAAARSHRRAGPLGRLRDARDEARGRGRRAARQDLARDRHRHPYGAGREEDPARGRVPGGARGVPRGRSRRAAVAEVLGDEARQHPRRGAGGARAGTGMNHRQSAVVAITPQRHCFATKLIRAVSNNGLPHRPAPASRGAHMRFLPTRRHRIAAAVLTLVLPSAWLLAGERRGTDAMVVAPVKRGPFAVVVTTAGELRARQFVQVTAPPGGQQAGVYQMKISSIVPEGTVVKQGDVVAELDRTTVAPKFQEVSLALQKADAQYEQAMLDSTLNLSTARENIRTMELGLEEKRLAKEQSVYEAPTVKRQAEIDYEKAQRALAQAKADYETKTEQARAKMREVGADVSRQRGLLKAVQDFMSGFTIKAPAPGMVIYAKEWNGKKRTTGSQVNAWDPGVAQLPDLTHMESVTYGNESDRR